MGDLDRLIIKRDAYRSQMDKQVSKSKALLQDSDPTDDKMDLLTATIEDMASKLQQLVQLDDKIQEASPLAELPTLIQEADDYATTVREN